MKPEELIALRKRMGWSQIGLARRLDISGSRLADYELGYTRGRNTPAPIPRVVELAILRLVDEETGVAVAHAA